MAGDGRPTRLSTLSGGAPYAARPGRLACGLTSMFSSCLLRSLSLYCKAKMAIKAEGENTPTNNVAANQHLEGAGA
jgi:hypothetical protein